MKGLIKPTRSETRQWHRFRFSFDEPEVGEACMRIELHR